MSNPTILKLLNDKHTVFVLGSRTPNYLSKFTRTCSVCNSPVHLSQLYTPETILQDLSPSERKLRSPIKILYMCGRCHQHHIMSSGDEINYDMTQRTLDNLNLDKKTALLLAKTFFEYQKQKVKQNTEAS